MSVLVITPETPNPCGAIAVHSSHSGVWMSKVAIATQDAKVSAAIKAVSHQ